jgi:hypothetical protein
MNQALVEFLLSLLRDPNRLRLFNTAAGRTHILASEPTLSGGDKEALLSGDSSDLLQALQVEPGEEDELMFVVGPGIKPPYMSSVIGWGIKGGSPIPPPPEKPGKAKSRPGVTGRKGGATRKGTRVQSRKRKGGKR